MNLSAMEAFAYLAMVAVAFWVPAYLARRTKHGEARFDKDGNLIDDERGPD